MSGLNIWLYYPLLDRTDKMFHSDGFQVPLALENQFKCTVPTLVILEGF